MKKTISIVIPVYNEGKNIRAMYEALLRSLKNLKYAYEIIFVNDGSRDNSLEILKRLAAEDRQVRVISFSRNFGHQVALTAGMKEAQGEACITMDCDFQDPPELIPEMIGKYEEGFHVVHARRTGRKDPFLKRITAKYYYKVLGAISNVSIPRNVGDFRLVDRKVVTVLNSLPERYRYLRGMVSWVGFKQTFVDFNRPNRMHGDTGYTWKKMFKLAADGILNFSFFPLKLGMYVGLLTMFFGFAFIVYMIGDAIVYSTVYPLYKWLIVVLFVFLGFLFILVWIMGEYIGRIYNEEKGRPLYIIDEKINCEFASGEDIAFQKKNFGKVRGKNQREAYRKVRRSDEG
ncbi:MAG: glycosyltransferase family 2 protein [Deltaproteobacteria bacterium]|nr:glycosyltransferase family 2 protein [Deltaproteobacteria bacterium]